MRIIVDGDASRRIAEVETIARLHNIEAIIYCDTKHNITSEYADVRIVDYGTDSVDFRIASIATKDDIIVTNDAGLASLVIAKGAFAINNAGYMFTEHNINMHLNNRYVRKETMRRTGRKQVKGTLYEKSRTKCSFKATLNQLIEENNK